MATVATGGRETLIDLATQMDPTGKLALISEQMVKVNSILEDMPFYEGNLPTGHRASIRASLPTVRARALNQFTTPSKGTYRNVQDTCAMIEQWGECDVKEASLSGDVAGFRFRKSTGAIQAVSQEAARLIFYGNEGTVPEEFNGLYVRYNDIDAAEPQVLNAGSSGSACRSIWLVCFSDQTVHGIYPRGSKAGLDHRDLGVQTAQDSSGGLMEVYRDHYTWDMGIHVADRAGVVRIANIGDTTVDYFGSTWTKKLLHFMNGAIGAIPSRLEGMGSWVFYCDKKVYTALINGAMEGSIYQLTIGQLREGVRIPYYFGIPVRRCDVLATDEAAIS